MPPSTRPRGGGWAVSLSGLLVSWALGKPRRKKPRKPTARSTLPTAGSIPPWHSSVWRMLRVIARLRKMQIWQWRMLGWLCGRRSSSSGLSPERLGRRNGKPERRKSLRVSVGKLPKLKPKLTVQIGSVPRSLMRRKGTPYLRGYRQMHNDRSSKDKLRMLLPKLRRLAYPVNRFCNTLGPLVLLVQAPTPQDGADLK